MMMMNDEYPSCVYFMKAASGYSGFHLPRRASILGWRFLRAYIARIRSSTGSRIQAAEQPDRPALCIRA